MYRYGQHCDPHIARFNFSNLLTTFYYYYRTFSISCTSCRLLIVPAPLKLIYLFLFLFHFTYLYKLYYMITILTMTSRVLQVVNIYHWLTFSSHSVIYAESIVFFRAIGSDPHGISIYHYPALNYEVTRLGIY